MSDRITISIQDGIADVRLNRADKMNAVDVAMFEALISGSEQLAKESGLRAVVLSGEGKAFCAGLDLSSFTKMAEPGGVEAIFAKSDNPITHKAQQAVYGWTQLPVPVIAAVNGVALGAGMQLALGADLRFVAPDAKMSMLEIRWGLIPDMTGTRRLMELVGPDVAMELSMTGRMVAGSEAVKLGLATYTAEDPFKAAMETAKIIASKSPDAIRAIKRLLRQSALTDDAQAFHAEREEISQLVGSPNQTEAVNAWFEKRQPKFTDPE